MDQIKLPPAGDVGPAEGRDPLPPSARKRRPLRAALFLVCMLAAGAVAVAALSPAWQRTQRREAYLPDLEAQARRAPTDGPLLALLGGRLMEAHEYAAAAETLRRSVGAGETGEAVWRALAASAAASGDRGRALADLKIGVRARPDAAELKAVLARAQAVPPSQPPAALAETISPEGPAPLIAAYAPGSLLGGISYWWGRRHPETSGFATRQQWAGRKPNDAQAQRLWGLALLRNRRLPEAEASLRRALALAPNSPAANLALADYLDGVGPPVKASLQYLACLRLRPDWPPALFGLGRSAAQAGMYGYATAAFARASQVDPQSVDAWIGLGRAYMEGGSSANYAPALAAFQTAARLAPGRADYLPDYANCLRLSNRWDEAEAALRRRLAAAPADSFSHFLLGLVLMDNDPTPARLAEAEAQTREALRLTPRAPSAQVQLAQLLLARRQTREALPLLTEAFSRQPLNRKTMKILARAYRLSGQAQVADRLDARSDALARDQQQTLVVESNVAKRPMDADLHAQLAALYRRTGAPQKADHEQALVQLLRTDPERAAREIQSLSVEVQSALPHR